MPKSVKLIRKKRKGSLKETLSYAMYKDNPELFTVTYRDMAIIKTAALNDFVRGEEMADIPITRILEIEREGVVVWTKGQKKVEVKVRTKGQ